jgi:tRNA threonylcarbamoyladenosine biosynthesis protein TsaB
VNVIAFDTATDDAVVGATCGGAVVYESLDGPGPDGRPSHSATLLDSVRQGAERLGGWESVDRVAVGIGPGTFTGLRIGIATALGLSVSAGVDVAGVSTLRALAEGLRGAGGAEFLVPVLDARRGEVFIAVYDSAGAEVEAPAALSPRDAVDLVSGLEGPVRVGGPGAVRFAEDFEQGGVEPVKAEPGLSLLTGAAVCALGEEARTLGAGQPLEPIYIRTPDAQLWLERDSRPTAG